MRKTAFMMRTLAALASLLSMCSAISRARSLEIDGIPQPRLGGAAFRVMSTDADSAETRLIATADGARIVVGKSLMLTGAKGTIVRPLESGADGTIRASLERGALLVHAGSVPGEIGMGRNILSLQEADVLLMPFRGGWLMAIVDAGSSGRASLGGAPLPAKQRIYHVDALGNETRLASDLERRNLHQALGRLRRGEMEPVLDPAEVEDPADRRIVADVADVNGSERIEIESIEVEIEADCIEICLD
jgi:hypothetical protein